MYRLMILSTQVGTGAYGRREDYTISRHHIVREDMMRLCKGGGGTVANCQCNLHELATMQQEVKVRVYKYRLHTEV